MTLTASPRTDARVARLRGLVDQRGLDAMLISSTANKRYFSGLRMLADEEATWPGTLLITRDTRVIFADSRYTEQAEHEAPGWEVILTTGGIGQDLPPILERDEIVPLRLVKTDEEIDAIGRACVLTDACFAHLVDFVRPGMTEREVAWELELWFRANGAESLAFRPLVLAGPRAAMPHGQPSDAIVERGNVLLIDFGCAVDGYRSDMTRTLFIGDVPEHVRRAHDAVRAAQAAAMEALAVGVNGQEVDALARRVIIDAGFEPFGHGLGHGIGLEVHEQPSLRKTRPYTLEAGMVFSVEPGIYQPGVTGVRIEDIVVLTEPGPRLLTNAPREPLVIE